MRQVRHPQWDNDLAKIIDHILEATGGDTQAAARRVVEVDALLDSIAANPLSGTRLGPPGGWLVRHGGQGQKITIVFRLDPDRHLLNLVLVAFGGQDWMGRLDARRDFGDA